MLGELHCGVGPNQGLPSKPFPHITRHSLLIGGQSPTLQSTLGTLHVQVTCPASERVCASEDGDPDGPRSCSKEGICSSGVKTIASTAAASPEASPVQLPAPQLVLLGAAGEVVDPAWGLGAWALCRGAQVEACDRGVAWELAPGTADGAVVEITACEEQVCTASGVRALQSQAHCCW